MKNLNSAQKKYLRGLAHHLKPVVQVGKNGLTEQLFNTVDLALNAHELIKVKFLDFQEEKDELSDKIAEKTHCHRVGMIGNTLMLYREHSEPEKRKIRIP